MAAFIFFMMLSPWVFLTPLVPGGRRKYGYAGSHAAALIQIKVGPEVCANARVRQVAEYRFAQKALLLCTTDDPLQAKMTIAKPLENDHDCRKARILT
jgi:hypothetical protein